VSVPRAHTLSHAEVKGYADKLNSSLVKDLRYIYNQIYAIHHGQSGAQGKVAYTFSPEAKKLFNEHTSSTVAAANAVFNGESQAFIDSKDEKHIIRLSCIIHVLKDPLHNALGLNGGGRGEATRDAGGRDQAETTSAEHQASSVVIPPTAMKGAIAVAQYYAEQKSILSKVFTF